MKIDNYALSMWQTCPAKYWLRIKHNWAPRRASAALEAGKILHRGLEEWYRTGNLVKAMNAIKDAWPVDDPMEDWRNMEKVLATMVEYTRRYSLAHEPFKIVGADGGDPVIEASFSIPTGMYLDICAECGNNVGEYGKQTLVAEARDLVVMGKCPICFGDLEPIEYGGIFDLLVEWNGVAYVVDHKTTTQFGPYYYSQYNPNNQITGYVWGAEQMSGRKVGGAVINVIAWYRSQGTKFDRQITTRTPADIATWLENVRQVCNQIQRAEMLGEFPMNTSACTLYGACEFKRVHELSTEREREAMLSMSYEQRPWDHEARDEVAKNG
jgi:hypothetical protein